MSLRAELLTRTRMREDPIRSRQVTRMSSAARGRAERENVCLPLPYFAARLGTSGLRKQPCLSVHVRDVLHVQPVVTMRRIILPIPCTVPSCTGHMSYATQ